MKEIKLTEADLHKLTTPRLLNYRTSLLSCPEEVNWDSCCGIFRPTKAHLKWRQHYALVKSILATREHVVRKVKK
jgi:hypothetical protein